MRRLGRTRKVSMAWLYKMFQSLEIQLKYIDPKQQRADIYTKAFLDNFKRQSVCGLIPVGDRRRLLELLAVCGAGVGTGAHFLPEPPLDSLCGRCCQGASQENPSRW